MKKKIKSKPMYKGPVITTAQGTFRQKSKKKPKQKKDHLKTPWDEILALLKSIKDDLELLRQPPMPPPSEDYKPGNGTAKSNQQWSP